jgi:uncharacterized RDD family membrane protein YckC
VDLEDRITIPLPEGGVITLQLAGLGSRFIAGTVDLIIQLVLVVVLVLLTGAVSGGGHLDLVAFVIGAFLAWFGYPIAFEVLARGRTPGKRFTQLRVVREDGNAVDLSASAIRNFVRLLDGQTLLYVPTVISILATQRNQRPGDLAAGTLVIRDAPRGATRENPSVGPHASLAIREDPPAWDVSGVSQEELAAVRSFLDRRDTLDREARSALAERLATGLAAKVAGAQRQGSAEQFLLTLVELKMDRS